MYTYQVYHLPSDRSGGRRIVEGAHLKGIEGICSCTRTDGKKDYRFALFSTGGDEQFLFVDVDHVPLEQAKFVVDETLKAFPGSDKAHIATHTGGGVHVYIPIYRVKRKIYRAYRKNYEEKIGSLRARVKPKVVSAVFDMKHQANQLGRIPGTINGKLKYGEDGHVRLLSCAEGLLKIEDVLGEVTASLSEEETVRGRVSYGDYTRACPLAREYEQKPKSDIFRIHKVWHALAHAAYAAGRGDIIRPRPGHEDKDHYQSIKDEVRNKDGEGYLYGCSTIAHSEKEYNGETVVPVPCIDCPHRDVPGATMALNTGDLCTPAARSNNQVMVEKGPLKGTMQTHVKSYLNHLQNLIHRDFFVLAGGKKNTTIYAYDEENILRVVGDTTDPVWFEDHPYFKENPPTYEMRDTLVAKAKRQLTPAKIEAESLNSYEGLPLKNGILSLVDGEYTLREYTRQDRATFRMDFTYDPEAKSPLLEAYFDSVCVDEVMRARLMLAAALVFMREPMVSTQKFFWVYGPSGTGKSTYHQLISSLLSREGSYAGGPLVIPVNPNKFQFFPEVTNAMMFLSEEVGEKVSVEFLEWLKVLTGQDEVSFERKGKDAVWKKVTGGFFLTSNEYPQALKQVPGLERRMFPLSFPKVVPEEERVNILGKLTDADKSWFLAEALNVYYRYKTEDMGIRPYEDSAVKADLVENPLDVYFRENYEIDFDHDRTLTREIIEAHDHREDTTVGHHTKLAGEYREIRKSLERVFSVDVAKMKMLGISFNHRFRGGRGYSHLRPLFSMEEKRKEAKRRINEARREEIHGQTGF